LEYRRALYVSTFFGTHQLMPKKVTKTGLTIYEMLTCENSILKFRK
jgi:hypothetical protein